MGRTPTIGLFGGHLHEPAALLGTLSITRVTRRPSTRAYLISDGWHAADGLPVCWSAVSSPPGCRCPDALPRLWFSIHYLLSFASAGIVRPPFVAAAVGYRGRPGFLIDDAFAADAASRFVVGLIRVVAT